MKLLIIRGGNMIAVLGEFILEINNIILVICLILLIANIIKG